MHDLRLGALTSSGISSPFVPTVVRRRAAKGRPTITANPSPTLAPTPHRGVKTTRGAVSRIGPPAIHMRPSVHPLAPRCLAASRPGRPLPDGPHRPWR